MADPNLASTLISIPLMLLRELLKYWWFWLIIIILILLVKIIPLVVNKKLRDGHSQRRCPNCGGDLVEKRKYGRFLACSNYPKCRFTKKID